MSERIVILGATGQVGLALRRRLDREKRAYVALGPDELDLTSPGAVARVAKLEPTALINAAAWTDVRGAERAVNRQLVWEVNCHGPRRLAEGCAAAGIPLVHISTDYVFDGRASDPYKETDETNPLQAYGASKLDGEREVARVYPEALIARTSTVYGDRPEGPRHYVDAILAQAMAAYLVEGRPKQARELFRRIGRGEATLDALRTVTGLDLAAFRLRLIRWLREREA